MRVLLDDLVFPWWCFVSATAGRDIRFPDKDRAAIKKRLLRGQVHQDMRLSFQCRVVIPGRQNRVMRSLASERRDRAMLVHPDIVRQLCATCAEKRQRDACDQ